VRNGEKKLKKNYPERIKVLMAQNYNASSKKTSSEEVSEKCEEMMRGKSGNEAHKKYVAKMKDAGRHYT
jgi:hypothetical protein